MVKVVTYDNEVIKADKVEFANLDYGKVIIDEGTMILDIADIKCIRSC